MSDFKKNLITLVSGAGLVHSIPILLTPLLTRFYTPGDFGLLAIYSAVVGLLGTVVCGRYELTVMHAKNQIELANSLTLSFLVTCISCTTVVLVMCLYSEQVAVMLGASSLKPWLVLTVLPVCATGAMQMYVIYLSREKKFKDLVKGRIIQSLSTGLISVLMVSFRASINGLLVGYIVGLLCAIAYFYKNLRWPLKGVSFNRMRILLVKHRQYPFFSAPAALLDVATQSIVVFLLARFYTGDILGYFSQSHRLLLLPLALIGTSVAQVFFQHASEQRKNHVCIHPLLKQTTAKLLLYSAPCFIIFILVAPSTFEILLGKGWFTAGEYGRLAALAYWVRLGVSPVSSVFMVVDRVKLGAVWQLTYFCSSVAVLGLAASTHISITSFFIVYAIHEVILYGLYFMLASYVCKEDDLNRLA